MNSIDANKRSLAERVNLEPISPVFQTGLIVVGNVVIFGSVLAGMRLGGFRDKSLPEAFWIAEAIIVGVGAVTAWPEDAARLWFTIAQKNYDPSTRMAALTKARDRLQGYVVYVLTATGLFALAQLVNHTGGIAASPFLPFLTAPALFGPFVAKGGKAVFTIVVVIAGVLVGLTELTGQFPASNPPMEPSAWLVAGVSLILVVGAGCISATRLERERELIDVINELRTTAAALEGGAPRDARLIGVASTLRAILADLEQAPREGFGSGSALDPPNSAHADPERLSED
jgi:hypothetical protein